MNRGGMGLSFHGGSVPYYPLWNYFCTSFLLGWLFLAGVLLLSTCTQAAAGKIRATVTHRLLRNYSICRTALLA
eukprot:143729-Amphidinium_carterae.1